MAQATQNYITAMDALKLDMTAVDEIQPQLQDLFESLNKIPDLPPDFEVKMGKLVFLFDIYCTK